MPDKTEKILVWSEVAAILITLFLVFGGWRMFSKIIMTPLEHLLTDKLFDIALALFGTWFGYWLAKKHLEHFVSGIVKKMDDKYLDLNKQNRIPQGGHCHASRTAAVLFATSNHLQYQRRYRYG